MVLPGLDPVAWLLGPGVVAPLLGAWVAAWPLGPGVVGEPVARDPLPGPWSATAGGVPLVSRTETTTASAASAATAATAAASAAPRRRGLPPAGRACTGWPGGTVRSGAGPGGAVEDGDSASPQEFVPAGTRSGV